MRSFKRIMRPAILLSIVVSVWMSTEIVLAVHNEDGHLSFIIFALTVIAIMLSIFLFLAWIIAIGRHGPKFVKDLKNLSIMRDGVQWLEKNAFFGLYIALAAKIVQILFEKNDLLYRAGRALFPTGIFVLCLCGGTCLILVTLKKLGLERLVTNKVPPRKKCRRRRRRRRKAPPSNQKNPR